MNRNQLYKNFFKEQVEIMPSINDSFDLPEFKHLKSKMENSFSQCQKDKETELYTKYYRIMKQVPISQQTNYDKILFHICKSYLDTLKYNFDDIPINPHENEIIYIVEAAAGNGFYTFGKKGDYQIFIEKIQIFPEIVNSIIFNMRRGMKRNNVLPKVVATDLLDQLKNTLKTKSWTNNSIKYKLSFDFNKACTNIFKAPIEDIIHFLESEYIPVCRKTIGMVYLPNGKKQYEFLVKNSLTDKYISIHDIHEFGLLEVKRIHDEMNIVQQQLEFKGTRKDFFKHMRSRKDLKFKSKKEVLTLYKNQIEKIKSGLMKKAFHDKIKTKCTVKQVPEYNEEFAPEAYYLQGDFAGKRPGKFFINMRKLEQMSKIDIESLTLHEVFPGHHYHLSYLNEKKELPLFIQNFNVESFVEGWGLYSENLGEYETLESYFGKLVMELLRAIRLVVDTGIHYYGWSYSKTFNYMKTNGYDNDEQINQQIIRYICIPSQALAYKMGEKCIIECLNKFIKKGNTDIRDFHRKVIEDGIIPLWMLREKFN